MTNDSTPTRRTVLIGLAGALTAGGVVTAQETTTEDGETTTADGETTTAGGQTTAQRGETTRFQVYVLNVSEFDALTPEGGEEGPVILSPGAYAVHSPDVQLFAPGEAASSGIESLAEDGNPTTLAGEIEGVDGIFASGTFDTAVAVGSPGPIGPGAIYGFEVEAAPGDRLSLATMFVPSNDLFYAPGPEGIPFFRDGDAVSGSVTDQIALWDAGTEQNEEPGAGPNQAPRQSGPNTGPAEDATVRRIEEVDDGYEYPSVSDSIRVIVVPEAPPGGDETTQVETTAAETTTE